jgi:hypothetical protein
MDQQFQAREAQPRAAGQVWRTILAIPTALVVWAAIASVAGAMFGFWNSLTQHALPILVGPIAVILGGIVGVIASRGVCDRLYKAYARRMVFIPFWLVGCLGLSDLPDLLAGAPKSDWVSSLIDASVYIVTGLTAYVKFWRAGASRQSFFATAAEIGRFKRLTQQIVRGGDREEALHEFAAWMASRPAIALVLANHGHSETGSTKLIRLFWDLMSGGAGQIISTRFVPLVAISDAALLNSLLEIENASPEPSSAKIKEMAFVALEYVEATYKGTKG